MRKTGNKYMNAVPDYRPMKDDSCCYADCPEPGTIHIGINGGDSHWICWRHLDLWNKTRARFLADCGGCEMQELGELLERDMKEL